MIGICSKSSHFVTKADKYIHAHSQICELTNIYHNSKAYHAKI